jgi:ketosteroid isomerase-like protein
MWNRFINVLAPGPPAYHNCHSIVGVTVAGEIISADEVRSEVARFWDLFLNKSAEALAEFYSHDATVFNPISERSEPGRVAVIRRTREYFHPEARIDAQIGPVEVQVLDDHVAVATYNFSFTATHVADEFHGETTLSLKNCRATQIFVLQPEGGLRIIHEHMSTPAKG